jgi:hypothetical protein
VTPLPAAIAAYAGRLHRAIGSGHHVASPLGAWLVLALAARGAADSQSRARLAEVLGLPADDAAAAAQRLLANPHGAVRLAAAAWHSVDTPPLRTWLDDIAGEVEVGAIPSSSQADEWAHANTDGLIDRFPLEIDDETLLVLASAVACAISWQTPFLETDAAALTLPRASGFDEVRSVLRTPSEGAQVAIVDSDVGLLAAHAVPSNELDMLVVSVIADPAAPAPSVLVHAHDIAIAYAERAPIPGARSLFDLPLGAAHSWMITEQTTTAWSDQERFDSVLPAWSAESTHELTGLDGFADAAAGLAALLPPDPRGHAFAARQAALARYTRTGFEAAAVTAMGLRSAAMQLKQARLRTARVEFMHPYAVVAVSVAEPSSPWAALPLFSAWIAQADEA